jgi:hypothetical protein
MLRSAFGIVASALCAFCAVSIYIGQTDTADIPKAGFVRPISLEPSDPDSHSRATENLQTAGSDVSSAASVLSVLVPTMVDEVRPLQSPIAIAAPPAPSVAKQRPPTQDSSQIELRGPTPDLVPDNLLIFADDTAIDVPPGAPLPVAVFVSARQPEFEAGYTAVQREAAERVASDFTREIAAEALTQPLAGENIANPQPKERERWDMASSKADERFRALLGDETYNRELILQHQLKP